MKHLRTPHFLIPSLAAALLLTIGIATAQPPGVPNPYAVASPTGAEQIDVENLGTGIATVQLTQVRDAAGYLKAVPTTGTTLTLSTNVSVVQATPAGTLTAWTVVTPPSPVDGQRLQIFSTAAITTFNLTAASGQTVHGNLAGALAANGNVEYLYSASNTTWDRIQ